jgi:5-hydroxyisourate hydrolase
MTQVTCHVLDTALGCPAVGVPVVLSHLLPSGQWRPVCSGHTDDDGRVKDWVSSIPFISGTYRVSFDTGAYLTATRAPVFFPYVDVVFVVESTANRYHIPLLLSPFGYSTYRGS